MRENRVMNDYLFYYIFVDQFIPVSSRFHCTVIVCVCSLETESELKYLCCERVSFGKLHSEGSYTVRTIQCGNRRIALESES